jgi:pyruvate-formate lyase-activating enzyme
MVAVAFRPFEVAGLRTGALDIQLEERRVLSVPTQLGCRVGCTFCVSSSTSLARNLRTEEMVAMVRGILEDRPADRRPIELSFTGEGEGLLNLRAARAAALEVDRTLAHLSGVRYSFSGLGAPRLLREVPATDFPTRLQFSLHAARQSLRNRLVPNSAPLADVLPAMRAAARDFVGIELNVVLQDGVNDSDEDLRALAGWGDPAWPILLNPLLSDGRELVAQRTTRFESELHAAGRTVRRYTAVAAGISRDGIYPQLTARPQPAPEQRIALIAMTAPHSTSRRPRPR